MAEPDRFRVAAMLAADAKLDIWAYAPPAFHCNRNHLANARGIDGHEWIALDQSALQIFAEERSRIVARHPQRGLGEIIRAETEKLRGLRELSGHKRGPGQFDHGANEIGRP